MNYFLLGIFFLHTVANANPKISDQPITPFKLATFEANNSSKIGIAIQGKLLDLSSANRYVSKKFNLFLHPGGAYGQMVQSFYFIHVETITL